jgi:hypothetical protein
MIAISCGVLMNMIVAAVLEMLLVSLTEKIASKIP